MANNTAPIANPLIYIKPSQKLVKYILNIEKSSKNIPLGLRNIMKTSGKSEIQRIMPLETKRYLITDEDKKFLHSLNLKSDGLKSSKTNTRKSDDLSGKTMLLCLEDLYWLYDYIQMQNNGDNNKVYLHELMKGCDIVLPKNVEVPRNEELEKRCQKLKAEQENREYHNMTKNVDNLRRRMPEDTIGYQIRQMNKQLIAVFQFIISVLAGFAFGFIGVELIIGNLDFGFRLLLGIICSLVIALAELYFLAKKLNEDLHYEFATERQTKNIKID